MESLVKELLDFYSPEETAFFDKLQTIIQFVAKDPNKCLEPVWKIQDSWPKDDNGILVFKLHQCVLSCVNELAPEHVDFLISDIQVRVDRLLRPHFLDSYIVIFITFLSRHVGSRPVTLNATQC